MDLRQLSTFIQIAQLGSVSKAANKLHTAQPALSRQIRMLEDELHVRLFDRHGRGMRLTEAGELFLARSQAILTQLEDTRSELLSCEMTVRGNVRIGMPPTVGDVIAAPLIEKFHTRYPEVMIRVVPAFSGYLIDFLSRGEVDLAIVYNVGRHLDVGLTPLVEEKLYLVGPARADLSRHASVTLAAAAENRLVLPGPAHGLRVLLEKEARRRAVSLSVAMEADALQILKQLVKRDMGFTILPMASIYEDVVAGSLTAAPIVQPDLVRKLVLARALGQPWSNAVKLFVEMLQAEIGAMISANILDGRLLAR